MAIKSFEDLEIYQLAEELTIEIYKITAKFPKEEQFGLTSQLRRAISSVGANIAEAFGRFHYKDKINFLYHARGSLLETRHFLRLASKLGFISSSQENNLSNNINTLGVKLNNFIKATARRVQ